jgi:Ni,Fe-hydrogenase maturation factor
MLKELKDLTSIDIKVLVVQIESIPDEVMPGLSKPVQDAVYEACRRVMQILQKSIPLIADT